jgi:hypothetical protein
VDGADDGIAEGELMRALVLLCAIPATLAAQRLPPLSPRQVDGPGPVAAGRLTPATALHPGVTYSQFDSLGTKPLGAPGDSVTLYLFSDGQHLDRVVHARITGRRRLVPPRAWRDACDALAHPGWYYSLSPSPTAPYGIILPGVLPMPESRPPTALARGGARLAFESFAQRVWQRYLAAMQPATDRHTATLWYDYFGDDGDAGWSEVPMVGLREPGGHLGGVLTFWLHDDRDDPSQNTTGTWIVDAWGIPLARAAGNLDLHGTVDTDADGVEEIVTAGGLIEYRDGIWHFPPAYSEEPCLARRMGLGI